MQPDNISEIGWHGENPRNVWIFAIVGKTILHMFKYIVWQEDL